MHLSKSSSWLKIIAIPTIIFLGIFIFSSITNAYLISSGQYAGVQVTSGGDGEPCSAIDRNGKPVVNESILEDFCSGGGGGGGGGTTTPTTTNYTLNTSVTSGSETGSITWSPWGLLDGCNTTCSVQKTSGTAVSLFAKPSSKYDFNGWGGDCVSYGTGTCYLTMNSNKTVSASFGNSSESVNKSSVIVYVAETPGPTGIITAEKEGCLIDEGNNTCDIRFDWQTNNPVNTSSVTRSPESGFTIQNANSGEDVSLPVTYGGSTFYLYNSEIELSNVSVDAECISGTTWVSSQNKCIKDVSVKSFSTPSCQIEVGKSSCTSEISWEVTGGYGDFSVTTPVNTVIGSGRTGVKAYTIEYPSRSFYLYNNSEELVTSVSYADCVSGSSWSTLEKKCVLVTIPHECLAGTTWNEASQACLCDNGASNPPICTTVTPHECSVGTTWNEVSQACLCDNGASNPPVCNLFGTLSKFEVKDCSIKSNESTCQTKLNWTSTLLGTFAITTPEQITVSTASSGTDVPYTVEYPSRKFFAYNNSNLVEEKIAYAKCEDGNIWSTGENKCVPAILCGGDSERDVYLDCPLGYEGKIIRKQFKTYPECTFPEPVTEENSILINNNCKPRGDNPDPQWTRTCDECTEGVAQVRCVEKNENGDVRDFVMNCPGDTDGNGGGSGNSVLNITLKATPEKIMKGRLSTITWSSNADSCRAIPVPGYLNDFNTGEGNRPNGFDTVKPLSNNLYKIECTKGEITESKMIEVKVINFNIIEL